jgi:5'-nucleotidase
MILLVDMDGVIADFEKGHQRMCHKRRLPLEVEALNRKEWDILEAIPEEFRDYVLDGWHAPGFFRDLPMIEGAYEAMHKLVVMGIDVWICTAPLTNHATCAEEKLAWVRDHLGREFTSKVIITKDKTLVRGDVLVDDRPVVEGCLKPTWRQWLFDQWYNRSFATDFRVSWEDVVWLCEKEMKARELPEAWEILRG